jgi:hypothetical protein
MLPMKRLILKILRFHMRQPRLFDLAAAPEGNAP